MFASVAYIPLADATAISFLNPVFGMILAIPLLGEKVGKWRWLAAAIAFVGAMILLRPTPASFQPAALLALGAAVVMGFELNIIKKLTRREGPFSILVVNNALGVCVAGLAVIWVWQAPTLARWGLMAAIGGAMAVAQTCFVNAMARADASFVAPFSYGTLIFAALYDAVFFKELPGPATWLGAAIIITGAIWLALREARAAITEALGLEDDEELVLEIVNLATAASVDSTSRSRGPGKRSSCSRRSAGIRSICRARARAR